jgi:hypothetical protein
MNQESQSQKKALVQAESDSWEGNCEKLSLLCAMTKAPEANSHRGMPQTDNLNWLFVDHLSSFIFFVRVEEGQIQSSTR